MVIVFHSLSQKFITNQENRDATINGTAPFSDEALPDCRGNSLKANVVPADINNANPKLPKQLGTMKCQTLASIEK